MCALARRFSAQDPIRLSSPNPHPRFRTAYLQDLSHIGLGYGYASCCRSEIGPGDVEEHGATEIPQAWPVIVPQDHDRVVEVVLPPHMVRACLVRNFNRLIVTRIVRRLAPAIVRLQEPARQSRRYKPHPVRPEDEPPQRPIAFGRGAIAFPLQHLEAAPSHGTAHRKISGRQQPGPGACTDGADMDLLNHFVHDELWKSSPLQIWPDTLTLRQCMARVLGVKDEYHQEDTDRR